MKQQKRLCNEVETVRQLTYLGDKVSTGGGCEAAVTARTCWWVKLKNVSSYCMERDYI